MDELAGPQPLPSKTTFDKPHAADPALPTDPKDLGVDSPTPERMVMMVMSSWRNHTSQEVLPIDFSFSSLYSSSEDASQPSSELDDWSSSNSLPDDLRKQGVSKLLLTRS